jgi:hypothetical protein
MATILNLKVKYEDELRRIPATHVTKENGRLSIYNGGRLVGEFSDDKVELSLCTQISLTLAVRFRLPRSFFSFRLMVSVGVLPIL